jgi:hypothetical protein
MTSLDSRRRFIACTGSGLALGPFGAFATLASAQTTSPAASSAQESTRPPALGPTLVQEFVRKAHADLSATKAMLAEQPGLLNATWDWGGGDFEAGIGGAGHMGNREIAEFLIGQGARLDLFVAAMLGKLDIVQALLTAWPPLIDSRGPHGISLLRHARAGGEAARAVEAYLLSRGAK